MMRVLLYVNKHQNNKSDEKGWMKRKLSNDNNVAKKKQKTKQENYDIHKKNIKIENINVND